MSTKNRKWTNSDVLALKSLVEKDTPREEVAKLLDRTVAAVYTKTSEMGKKDSTWLTARGGKEEQLDLDVDGTEQESKPDASYYVKNPKPSELGAIEEMPLDTVNSKLDMLTERTDYLKSIVYLGLTGQFVTLVIACIALIKTV